MPRLEKQDIRSMYLTELEEMLGGMGQPKFRAAQLYRWLQSGETDFDNMTNIPQTLRNELKEKTYIADVKIVRRLCSRLDETV